MDRHGRQARLADVGAEGQARIGRASAEVRSEGFAGEVAARYLAGAGVARVIVRDPGLSPIVTAIDPHVLVDVHPSMSAEPTPGDAAFRDPAARELAQGARSALIQIRAALKGSS
jgi:hypothetical protein